MKRFLAAMLCAVLLSQTAIFVGAAGELDLSTVTNIAKGKAAFSINSEAGTNASMAVDGKPETYWRSANANGLKEYFVVDLGAAYSLEGIGILPATADSAQNFTVYGATTSGYYLESNRVELCSKTSVVSIDAETVLSVASDSAFRYLIFVQDKSQPLLGFAEISAYTLNANAQIEAESGATELISKDKPVQFSSNTTHSIMSSLTSNNAENAKVATDGDATSKIGTSVAATESAPRPIRMIVNLETPTALSHIVYQYCLGVDSSDYYKGFKVVASESNPAAFDIGNYDVLYEVTDAVLQDEDYNTGIIVFEIPEDKKNNSYQYFGIIKEEPTSGGTNRLGVSTLQAYKRLPAEEEPEPILPELDMSAVTNIASGKAAFSINAENGTMASMAVDGDASTYWRSANANGLNEYFVIDLGAEYPLAGIGFLPASAESAKNFTVYGANETTFSDKVELTAVTDAVTSIEEITRIAFAETDEYRYLILVQENNQPLLGFAEIEAYTPNEYASTVAKSGAVSIMSRGKQAYFSNRPAYNSMTSLTGNKLSTETTDDNASSSIGASGVPDSTSSTRQTRIVVDLGEEMPVSHVVYQCVVAGSDYASDFKVVASNSNSMQFNMGEYDVLYTVNGALARDEQGNTGTLVFELPEKYKGKTYRYFGIVKENPVDGTWRLAASTLQAYCRTADIAAMIDKKGAEYIINDENRSASDGAVSYSAKVLNNEQPRSFVGLFAHYNENNMAFETAYRSSELSVIGGYNEVKLSIDDADTASGTWELAILDGLTLARYMRNMSVSTELTPWEGSSDSEITVSQSGNSINAKGKIGANLIGMIILKPGASFDDYAASDVYKHEIIRLPKRTTAAWNFEFAYTFPEDAEEGEYQLGFFCDNPDSAVGGKTYTVKKMLLEGLEEDFAGVTSENFKSLIIKYDDFFEEVYDELLESDTAFSSFMLARDGFTQGVFDKALTSWSNLHTIYAAAKAAVVIDATLHGAGYKDLIAPHISAMPEIFNEDYNADEFEEMFTCVKEGSGEPTAEKLAEQYRKSIALSLIANGTLAEKEKALTDYGVILGISEESMDSGYSALKLAGKLKSDMATVKNTYSDGMEEEISDIIEQLKEEDESDDGGRVLGSDGGGGGSSKVSLTPVQAVYPEDKKAENTSTKLSYSDIAKHSWAHESIALLSERGIISGRGDGSFDPDGLLTREEAVKLLVLASGVVTEQSYNGYLDCDAGAWYYPYVTAAKANNLVSGFSRTQFGLGSLVTRQDLAVMVYRAMHKNGMINDTKAAEFTDMSLVSDYAADAVAALGGMEIIAGFEDGSFGPNKNATRAQAAVIFGKFLKMLDDSKTEGGTE